MNTQFIIISIITLFAVPSWAGGPMWGGFEKPNERKAEAVGTYTNGCLMGAQSLPKKTDGLVSIRRHRNRYHGHPRLIDVLHRFGQTVKKEGIGPVLIGDLSQPQGGPMASGHRSHQMGLDADLWFKVPPKAKRGQDEHFPSMVNRKKEVISSAWTAREVRLIELAAKDSQVERIFVHWVIKRELCRTVEGDRAWLGKVRPWWGHDRHFHIRLGCDAESADCIAQRPPPQGDGCGKETWFSNAAVTRRLAQQKGKPPKKKKKKRPLPDRCLKLLKN